MMQKLRVCFLYIFLFSTALVNSGCFALLVGAAAGAGAVAYIQGILEKNLDKTVAQVHKATQKGLKDLEFFITKDELNKQSSAHFLVEEEDGKQIKIDIEALTEKSSKLSIRIGTFGDEVKSYRILNAIEKHL